MSVKRPCIERLANGRGCPRYAVGNGSRCEEHQREANRRHYENTSPGTTAAWAKQRKRVLRRDGYRCRSCGRPEQKVNGRSNLQAHHLDGGGIRSNAPDDRIVTLCVRCHTTAQGELNARQRAS